MKDGSRRTTLRNRRFLRKISPLCRKRQEQPLDDMAVKPANDLPITTNAVDEVNGETICQPPEEIRVALETPAPSLVPDNVSPPRNSIEFEPSFDTDVPNVQLRRGGRESKQRKPFTAKMTGKYHE